MLKKSYSSRRCLNVIFLGLWSFFLMTNISADEQFGIIEFVHQEALKVMISGDLYQISADTNLQMEEDGDRLISMWNLEAGMRVRFKSMNDLGSEKSLKSLVILQ